MKKTCIRWLVLCLAVVMLSTALVSCGKKLNGTYVNNTFGLIITYTFSGKEYTRTISGLTQYDTGITVSGVYRIEGDTIYLATPSGNVEELSYSKNGKTIYIADMEYEKQ